VEAQGDEGLGRGLDNMGACRTWRRKEGSAYISRSGRRVWHTWSHNAVTMDRYVGDRKPIETVVQLPPTATPRCGTRGGRYKTSPAFSSQLWCATKPRSSRVSTLGTSRASSSSAETKEFSMAHSRRPRPWIKNTS